jgi:hypothetical protein
MARKGHVTSTYVVIAAHDVQAGFTPVGIGLLIRLRSQHWLNLSEGRGTCRLANALALASAAIHTGNSSRRD